ncbi:MAG TPA: TonB family protein [Usitatibacter sp.]|jgi:TonB family protein
MIRWVFVAAALLAAGCAGPQAQPQEAPKPEPPKVLPHDPAPAAHLDASTCARLEAAGPLTVVYPASAWDSGQEGWVHVRFDVDAEGAASNVRQLGASPPGIFDEAAGEMLAKVKFTTPSLKDCEFVFGFAKQEAAK